MTILGLGKMPKHHIRMVLQHALPHRRGEGSYRSVPYSEIDGQSAGDDQQPRPCRRWPIKEEHHENDSCSGDVERWQPGITPGMVWTIRIRSRAPQTKKPRD